jgi:hypothetical protein
LTAGNAGSYAGLNGLTLIVRLNGGTPQTFSFTDSPALGLTALNLKDQINGATVAPSGFSAYVHTSGASTYLQLRSSSTGASATLEVLDGTANTILGLRPSFLVAGITTYVNDKINIAQASFPDPTAIADQRNIDESSIRVFMTSGTSTTLTEFKRTETFLRRKMQSQFIAPTALAASIVIGATDDTFAFKKTASGTAQEYTIANNTYNATTLVAAMNACTPTLDADITFYVYVSGGSNYVRAVSETGYFEVTTPSATSANTKLGFTGSSNFDIKGYTLEASDDADGDTSTPFVTADLDNWGTTAGSATTTATNTLLNSLDLNAKNFVVGLDGAPTQDVSFEGGPITGGKLVDLGNALSGETLTLLVGGVSKPILFTANHASVAAIVSEINSLASTNVAYPSIGAAGTYLAAGTFISFMQYTGTLTDGVLPTQVEGGNVVIDRSATSNQAWLDLGMGTADPFGPVAHVGPIVAPVAYNGAALNGKQFHINLNTANKATTIVAANPVAITTACSEINVVAGKTVAYPCTADGGYAIAGPYVAFMEYTGVLATGVVPLRATTGDLWLDQGASTAWTDMGFLGTADVFADASQPVPLADVLTTINGAMGAGFATWSSNQLKMDSSTTGYESKIEVGAGTANTILGVTSSTNYYGAPYAPFPGDAVYGAGTFIGNIVAVSPGGDTTKLKLDREVSTTYGAANMYIIAQNLTTTDTLRPTENLIVGTDGSITLKHDVVRGTTGLPIAVSGQLLIAFDALRLDVTPQATNPALVNISSSTTLSTGLGPLTTDNPLGLMMYFMLINAPGVTISGLGVSATSTTFPDGTDTAYTEALTFLKGQEVYALAPASQSAIVHQLFAAHVTSASQADNKGERIVFINPLLPQEAVADLASSGTDGDSGAAANTFDTKVASLEADLTALGIDTSTTIPVSDGVYLDIATDGKYYNVSAVNGTLVTCRTAFAATENTDNFYTTSSISTALISETFSVYVRGATLVSAVTGLLDYDKAAQAYQDLALTYANRRVYLVAPEEVGATLGGTEQRIEGYYLCAAIAGMVGQQSPQQGFTNFPIVGFSRVIGSDDVFSETQMAVGAAGGTYWVVQPTAGGALTCRHQLSTDISSVEKRELSITKVVDFTAKFMRTGLRNFIGKFNITQPFLDTLSTVIQGQLAFLTESGVIIGGDINNIVQDSTNPDTVLIDVTLDVPYPCNYIRLTLVV